MSSLLPWQLYRQYNPLSLHVHNPDMAIPYVFLPPEMFAQLLRAYEMAGPIMRLPPETFVQIFSYLPSNALKCLRLTCKTFEPWATPPLFEELVITSRYADLEIADRIIDRFAPVIRNIRVCSQPIDDRAKRDKYFDYAVSYNPYTEEYKPFIHCKSHVEQFRKIWTRLKDESVELEMSTRLTDILCRVFETALQISRVTLTSMTCRRVATSVEQCWCAQAASEAQSRLLDPWTSLTDLGSWPVEQSTPYIRPEPLHGAWLRLMQALKKSRKPIQEIVMEPASYLDGVLTTVFAERQGYLQIISSIFASLTRLEIALYMGDDYMSTRDHLVDTQVAKMLSTAINLVHRHVDCLQHHIKIAIDDCAPLRTHFHAILEMCNFPRLKILRLDGVSAKPEQLLRFFKSHQCLLDVGYHGYRLGIKKWETLMQEIRNTTQLRFLKLDSLDFFELLGWSSSSYTEYKIYRYSKTITRDDGSSLILLSR